MMKVFSLKEKNYRYLSKLPKDSFTVGRYNDKYINYSYLHGVIYLSDIERHNLIDKSQRVRISKKGSFIRNISINLTTNCNMRCIYCYSNGGDFDQNISIENAKKLIDLYSEEIKKNRNLDFSRNLIFSSSGEPTLKFNEMREISEYAMSKIDGIHIHVDSNGVFPEKVLMWILKNVNSIGISLDGPPEIQSKTRPSKIENSIDIIEKNIKSLVKNNKRFLINSVFTKYSAGNELKILRYFINLGIKNLSIGPLEKEGRCDGKLYEEIHLDDKDFIRSFIKMKEIGDIADINIGSKSVSFLNNNIINYCSANTLTLLPTGEISICSKYTNINEPDLYKNLVIGKINKDVVLYDNKIKSINNRIDENSKCLSCDYFFLCGGGCPLRNLKENGNINIPSKNRCSYIKKFYNTYFYYLTEKYLIQKKPYLQRKNGKLHLSLIYSDFKLSEEKIEKSSFIIIDKDSDIQQITKKIVEQWNSNPKDFQIFLISVREKKAKIGNKILKLLNDLSSKNIPFIISRPIPRCLFYSISNFEKLKKFKNPKTIYDSLEFYEVDGNGKIKFFNGSYGKSIDEYEDRDEIKKYFFENNKNFVPNECQNCIFYKNNVCNIYKIKQSKTI